jgi:DNA-directed RNA polymerase specialized sigma24 family protein
MRRRAGILCRTCWRSAANRRRWSPRRSLHCRSNKREVVVLHAFEGLSFREAGEVAGISQDTAASRWRYACEKLKRSLTAKGVGP